MIERIHEATDKVKKLLEKLGYTVERIKVVHFGRHRLFELSRLIPTFSGYNKVKYKVYVVYQREPLKYFSKMYKYEEDVEAIGINYSVLKGLVDSNVNLVIFVFRDGRMYAGKPSEILMDAEDEGWIRTSKKTGEKIVNYPVTLLTLLRDDI
ncbi:MAG TPA: hypothetical protein ENF47_02990 [Thermoprotei archaeon]|nr:hypothetical protein [Thermoprotei archaeon]